MSEKKVNIKITDTVSSALEQIRDALDTCVQQLESKTSEKELKVHTKLDDYLFLGNAALRITVWHNSKEGEKLVMEITDNSVDIAEDYEIIVELGTEV